MLLPSLAPIMPAPAHPPTGHPHLIAPALAATGNQAQMPLTHPPTMVPLPAPEVAHHPTGNPLPIAPALAATGTPAQMPQPPLLALPLAQAATTNLGT